MNDESRHSEETKPRSDRDQWAGFGALSDSETDTIAGLDAIRAELRSTMRDRIDPQT